MKSGCCGGRWTLAAGRHDTHRRHIAFASSSSPLPLTRSYTAELLTSDFPLLGNDALFPFGCWTRQYSLNALCKVAL